MAEKTYLFRGLEVRSNQLERAGNTARDCSNVHLDYNNKLVKRKEFAGLSLPYDLTETPTLWDSSLPTNSTIIDFVEFNGKFILMVKTPPLTIVTLDFAVSLYEYDVDADTLTAIPFNNLNADFGHIGWANYNSTTFDGKITHFEKNGSLYFQSVSNSQTGLGSGSPILAKYDGKVWYAAGVPEFSSSFSNVADQGVLTPPDYYVRYLPMYIDDNGVQTFGEWRVEKQTAAASILSKATNTIFPIQNDYHYTYVWCTDLAGFTITDAALTFQASFSGTIGQVVYWLDSSFNLYRFTVAAYSGGNVTLSEPKLYTGSAWIDTSGFSLSVGYLDNLTSTIILSYFSVDYSAGFTFGDMCLASHLGTGGSGNISFNVGTPNSVPSWSLFSTYFEDFYGAEIKFNPPPAIQVREYGDACILADANYLYTSDLSLNGTVENFTPFDNFPVGEQEYGDIKCFFSNNTFIAVMREENTYLISGNIFTGNYRVQEYRATGKGGTSPASVAQVDGQCIFCSNEGPDLALENATIADLGDRIEPIFSEDLLSLDLDLSSADSFVDSSMESVFMAFKSNTSAALDTIILYDYRNKEWFKFDGMSCRGGLLVRKSTKKMYFSDGADIYEEQDSYTSGVTSYWKSNFETLGKASFKKRFQRLHVFLTSMLSGPIGFKAFKNWDTTTAYTDTTITPTSTIPMDNRRLNSNINYATSFELHSSGTNVFEVDGFEYSYEMEQDSLNDESRQ